MKTIEHISTLKNDDLFLLEILFFVLRSIFVLCLPSAFSIKKKKYYGSLRERRERFHFPTADLRGVHTNLQLFDNTL